VAIFYIAIFFTAAYLTAGIWGYYKDRSDALKIIPSEKQFPKSDEE